MEDWADPVEELINHGRALIKSQDLNGIAELRYDLAAWRGYVANKWSDFHRQYSEQKKDFLTADKLKVSVALAETMADATTVAKEMRKAKEMISTLDQLINACSTIVNVLISEKRGGDIDKIVN